MSATDVVRIAKVDPVHVIGHAQAVSDGGSLGFTWSCTVCAPGGFSSEWTKGPAQARLSGRNWHRANVPEARLGLEVGPPPTPTTEEPR